MLSTRQAATALGVHERTIRRYIAAGVLEGSRLPGGHYRIAEEAIAALLAPARTDAASAATRRRNPGPQAMQPPQALRSPGRGETLYDLSPAALRRLRARTETARG